VAHVIETEGLTKQWGDLTAVDHLDLQVEGGECYAFLGRNGAGKSTTARMLLDFIRPTSGRSTVLGGSGADPDVRRRIGYLPGDLHLSRTMTGNDAFRYYGELGEQADPATLSNLVDRFGLDPTRPVHELSTGNRRKVGLVLAFMHSPELLILDEPTSGLDPVLLEEFRTLLAERKAEGATIWITSHVMAEVERVADRVGLIEEGRMAQELTMDDLRRQTTGRIVFTFESPPDPDAFDGVDGISDVAVDGDELSMIAVGPVAALLSRAGSLGATNVRTEQRDLDDVFVDLYTHAGEQR
jgi:ABC-2 type transport system ATP-binding protein